MTDSSANTVSTYLIDEQIDNRGHSLGTTVYLDSGGIRQYRRLEFGDIMQQFAGEIAPYSNDGTYATSLNYGGQSSYQEALTSAPVAGPASGSGLSPAQAGNTSSSGAQGAGGRSGAYVPVLPLGAGDDAFSSYVSSATYGYGSLSKSNSLSNSVYSTGQFQIPISG